MHAAIRGLNSLADLEMLQSFMEKYFGNDVENRNPTLLEVVHFEEEVLRQKITWREKYEGVISGWLEPKSNKSKLQLYKPEQQGRDAGSQGALADGAVSAAAEETEKPVVDAKPDGGGPVKVVGERVDMGTVEAAAAEEKDQSADEDDKRIKNKRPRPDERSGQGEPLAGVDGGKTPADEIKPEETITSKPAERDEPAVVQDKTPSEGDGAGAKDAKTTNKI